MPVPTSPFEGGGGGGPAATPVGQANQKTEAQIQEQLDGAERNLQRVLASDQIKPDVRKGAEAQLRQVQAARAQGAAADQALAELGVKDRFLLGAGRNRAVRGLTTALSLPGSTVFSGLKEGVVDPITNLQGRADADPSSFSDFVGQSIGLGDTRQIGFGDVIEGADPSLNLHLKRVLGFGGELLLDPLNYIFGVGAVGDVAKASKAVRISDDALSGQILKAAANTADDDTRAAMRGAAAHMRLQGFSKLTDEELDAISSVARPGIGFRVPGQDTGVFFSGPVASRVSRGVTKPFATLRNAASRGDGPLNALRARRGAPRKLSPIEQKLRGKTTRDLRNAARKGGEDYANALALGDGMLAGRARGVGIGTRQQERFASRFGPISDSSGLPNNKTQRAIADLDVHSDEVMDAIEEGRRSATILGGREVSTGELIDEFAALHKDMRANGIDVGEVKGYISRQMNRMRDGSSAAGDWRDWRSLGDRDAEVHLGNLVKSRAYKPGDVISGQIDGSAVDIVLETGNLKELDRVFNSLDDTFFDRGILSNNPLEIMYRYQGGVAKVIGRKQALDDLIDLGFGVDARTIRQDPAFRIKQTLQQQGMTPEEAVDVLKIDSVELSTVLDNPDSYMDYARNHALDAPVEGAEKDLWYAAGDLMRQATDEGFDTPLGKYLAVRSQEAGYRATLTSMGRPMGDDALVNFAANMSDRQLRQLRQTMNRGDRLIPFTPEFATSPEMLEVLRGKASLEQGNMQFMQDINQIFKTQATLSPGFSVRNFYGGMFHNHLSGVRAGDYRTFTKGWEVAQKVRAAERQGLDVEEITKIWDDGIKDVADRKIIRDIYESHFVESSSRLGDALDFTLDTAAGPGARGATRARRQILGGGKQSLARAGDFLDRRIGGALGRMAGLRTGLGTGIPVEEVLRGSLMYKELKRGGADIFDANRTVSKFHFDYGDLTGTEKTIRNGFIPFYTFRSRNLPLQIEMLARRPGAYNNFLDFQRDMQDKYADPLMPGYYASFLAAPLDDNAAGTGLLRRIVGDNPVLTPDLPMNDLLELITSAEESVTVDQQSGGIAGQSLIAMPIGDSTPLWKLIPELTVNQSFFTGGPIAPPGDRKRRPIAPLGIDQSTVPIYRDILRAVGAALDRTPLADTDDDGNIMVDERLNYAVEQMLPLVGRTRRLLPDFHDEEDTRYSDRWNASVLGFMTGGFRSVNSRARLNAAYEFGETTRELLATMDELGYIYDDE